MTPNYPSWRPTGTMFIKKNHRYPVPVLPHHHCYLYDANLGHCQSPQPPEYHPTSSHHTPTQLVHTHGHHQPTEVVASESGSSLGIGAGNGEGFLDCPPLDDSLELGSLHHEGLTSDTLHGKSGKETFNGFPFNSATGGQNMLNSYGVQGEFKWVSRRHGGLHSWETSQRCSGGRARILRGKLA